MKKRQVGDEYFYYSIKESRRKVGWPHNQHAPKTLKENQQQQANRLRRGIFRRVGGGQEGSCDVTITFSLSSGGGALTRNGYGTNDS